MGPRRVESSRGAAGMELRPAREEGLTNSVLPLFRASARGGGATTQWHRFDRCPLTNYSAWHHVLFKVWFLASWDRFQIPVPTRLRTLTTQIMMMQVLCAAKDQFFWLYSLSPQDSMILD